MLIFLALLLTVCAVSGQNTLEDNGEQTKWLSSNTSLSESFTNYVFNMNKYVHFLLYTRDCETPQEIILNDVLSVLKSNYNSNRKTKILIHGWLSSANYYFSAQLKNAYIKARDYNIIIVDWSTYSYQIYPIARYAINYVGPHVSKFIDFLIIRTGLSADDIHILGHSLGAHIAGIAGLRMKYGPVARITGMDPAGPLLYDHSIYRLDASDAQFVDVIHTSVHYLGLYEPLGHADFYPNGGGPLQPGCGLEIGVCTHRRSYRYYIESLFNECGFLSRQCDSWDQFVANNCSDQVAYMGETVSSSARGKFYLRTATTPPYGLGDKLYPYEEIFHQEMLEDLMFPARRVFKNVD